MTTPKDKPDMGPIEVITSGAQRRRRWAPEVKRAILEEAEQPDNSLSAVARKYRVNPNLSTGTQNSPFAGTQFSP